MKPILVIQMLRMGDLILTFPLLLWLQRRFPGHEIVVVAEARFYRDIAGLGPSVRYVQYSDYNRLVQQDYSLVINVSHRREGAFLAGRVRAEEKIGPYLDIHDHLYIQGNWQLYRASLVNSNRHNTFHWAELNALDVISPGDLQATGWPAPRQLSPDNAKVGIFLGASQDEKRPIASLWIELAQALLARGMRPVLLGGPGERELGRQVAARLDVPVLNLAGTTSLSQFARIGQTLQLMITPDTGPMHLAAWTGLRTLNLSMGPVNPWETGPYQGGHYILRTTMSCSGCWSCRFGEPRCTHAFAASKIARLVDEVIRRRVHNLEKMTFTGLELMRSSRRHGLYWLDPVGSFPAHPSSRHALDRFWHYLWKWHFKTCDEATATKEAIDFVTGFPILAAKMRAGLLVLCRKVAAQCAHGPAGADDCFDPPSLPALAPCVRFARLVLENRDFSRAAHLDVLALFERTISLLE
jgi:ADP-heptose:LPS heptosyltransferase